MMTDEECFNEVGMRRYGHIKTFQEIKMNAQDAYDFRILFSQALRRANERPAWLEKKSHVLNKPKQHAAHYYRPKLLRPNEQWRREASWRRSDGVGVSM